MKTEYKLKNRGYDFFILEFIATGINIYLRKLLYARLNIRANWVKKLNSIIVPSIGLKNLAITFMLIKGLQTSFWYCPQFLD